MSPSQLSTQSNENVNITAFLCFIDGENLPVACKANILLRILAEQKNTKISLNALMMSTSVPNKAQSNPVFCKTACTQPG